MKNIVGAAQRILRLGKIAHKRDGAAVEKLLQIKLKHDIVERHAEASVAVKLRRTEERNIAGLQTEPFLLYVYVQAAFIDEEHFHFPMIVPIDISIVMARRRINL
ncbi:hypothetical protein D3C84_903220 [compost metagenome]